MNKIRFLLPIVLLAVGIGGFAALKTSWPKQASVPPKEQVWRVETMAVDPATLSPVLTLYGRVESPELTRAAAPGIGRVGKVMAREGQPVRKGQLLLQMDERDFLPRVEQPRGQVDELQASIRSEELRYASDLDQLTQERRLLDLAAADVTRYERMRQENFYSEAAVDQSRQNLARQQITLRSRELAIADHQARLALLKARLIQARANLEQAELALARSRVIAPFDGHVAELQVAEGDQVNNGQTLLTLYPSEGLELRAKIPAPHQAEILAEVGQGRTLEANARLAGEQVRLRLARLAGAADTRGLDGFFQVVEGHAQLRVGSLVTLDLARSPVDQAIAVPYTALYGGQQVYKVEGDRIRAVKATVVGELAGEPSGKGAGSLPMLLIRSEGLRRGDRVMTTHLPNALTGLRVEVLR